MYFVYQYHHIVLLLSHLV